MKKFIAIAVMAVALPAGAATVIYSNGKQIEVPDTWVTIAKPKPCPTPTPTPTPSPCADPYVKGCPLACDGPTPGDKCLRQRDVFGG